MLVYDACDLTCKILIAAGRMASVDKEKEKEKAKEDTLDGSKPIDIKAEMAKQEAPKAAEASKLGMDKIDMDAFADKDEPENKDSKAEKPKSVIVADATAKKNNVVVKGRSFCC